jgi:hypothetical protein
MRLISLAAMIAVLATPALADPVGTYKLRGVNPDSDQAYTGRVTVTRTDQTYKVVWKIGKDPLVGIGVGIRMIDGYPVTGPASAEDTGISIAYGTGDTFGTVIYFQQPDGSWHGSWAHNGTGRLATEDWFAKPGRPLVKAENRTNSETKTAIKSFKPLPMRTSPLPTQAGPKT